MTKRLVTSAVATVTMAVFLAGCGGKGLDGARGEQVRSTEEAVCSGATLSESAPVAPPNSMVTLTGSASCQLANPVYQFWVQDPQGNWSSPWPYDGVTQWQWTVPSTANPGDVYNFQFWAEEATSPGPYDTWAETSFTVGTAGGPCTNGTLSMSAYEAAAGANVQLSGGASCSLANPQFQFWVQDPSGTWTGEGWGTSSNYSWQVPSGAHNGDVYNWQVWVREAGSSATYDTWAGDRFVVGSFGACSGATITLDPQQGAAGSNVQVNGSASCNNPQFEFWIEDPTTGSWSTPSGWITSSSYPWTVPAGATNGQVYNWQVFVREAGSSASEETWSGAAFTVGTAACSNATLNLNPTQGVAGASVTVTGGATCSQPSFELWVEDPSGAWTTPTGWTTSSSYPWTVPAGATSGQTYNWQVWVREQGSNATYETWAAQSFLVSCTPGAQQCSGSGVQTCGSNGTWGSPWPCATGACSGGACTGSTTAGTSCASTGAGLTDCGASAENCCTSLEVPGGTFYRTYTNTGGGPTGEADPATLSNFRLDKYEVTVGRFRQFVAAWNGGSGWLPPAGSGKHAHLNGGQGLANSGSPGTYEAGWSTADNVNIAPTDANLSDASCDPTIAYSTWTSSAGADELLPINCLNWYEAAAFCIWDGGFLPSEAERGYAASAGSQQREYAWGSTAPGTANQYAIYACYYNGSGIGTCTGVVNIAPVGTPTLGAGLWGQLDLAGNMYQWVLDWYANYADPCVDCAYLSTTSARVLRGGYFFYSQSLLLATYRDTTPPSYRDNGIGIRCARTP